MAFTEHHLYFDDVSAGQEWMSLGRTVTETDIVNFAGLSGDFNPIHVDHEFAASTPYRRPIAHGLLVWSIASGLSASAPMMRTLAFMKVAEWHFREPVFVGDTIRCRTTVVGKTERARGRRGVVNWRRTLLNQSDKIVQEGLLETLVEGRAAQMRLASEDGQAKAIAG